MKVDNQKYVNYIMGYSMEGRRKLISRVASFLLLRVILEKLITSFNDKQASKSNRKALITITDQSLSVFHY